MDGHKILDIPGLILAIATFAISFYVLYDDTAMLFNCIVASLLGAGMIWGTYLTIRMCVISARKEK